MIKLLCGDYNNRLQDVPENSVDLILVDPPYVLDTHGGTQNEDLKRSIHNNHIKSISHGFEYSVFNKCIPLMRAVNILCFCSNKQVSSLMSYFEGFGYSTTLLCWHKTNPIPFANGKHLSDSEFIVYARGKGAHFNNSVPVRQKTKILSYPTTNSGKLHPTEKPLELIKTLVEVHSFKGDTVLDFCMGSGTTGVACVELGRSFVGCEIDKTYFKIAKERIIQARCTNTPQ